VISLAALGNDLYSGKTSLPFIAKRRIWYTIAIVVIALSAVLVVKPGLNPGIDFKGGSEVTVTGVADPSEGPGNDVLADKDLSSGSSVTTMGASSVRIQTNELDKAQLDELASSLATAYDVDSGSVSATTIGPTWSADVTSKAARGLVIFFLLVGALIWIYFRTWKMAAAALLALSHDIMPRSSLPTSSKTPMAAFSACATASFPPRKAERTPCFRKASRTLFLILLLTPLLILHARSFLLLTSFQNSPKAPATVTITPKSRRMKEKITPISIDRC